MAGSFSVSLQPSDHYTPSTYSHLHGLNYLNIIMHLSSSVSLMGKLLALTIGVGATSSSFPPEPKGISTYVSERWPGATISYKQTSICETTPGVKAWSGYISMPSHLVNKIQHQHQDYDSNLFFWYFEARHDPANAPTAIYLGGGPGYTSLDSMSVFPCIIGSDASSTTLNPHSWNNKVNMLYIDQPAGTGYSYVNRKNGTYDLVTETFHPLKDGESLPKLTDTLVAATLDPSPISTTLNTTAQAARVAWQFAQIFFQEFPKLPTKHEKSEISIWGTSFGGFWATKFLSHFLTQNEMIEKCKHPNENATLLPLGTLGIGNGCIDFGLTAESYPSIAYNNTLGIQVYNKTTYDQVIAAIEKPKIGCRDLVDSCRKLAKEGDPHGLGTNSTVNKVCLAASQTCWLGVIEGSTYTDTKVSFIFLCIFPNCMLIPQFSSFDMSQVALLDDLTDYFTGFYNQHWVQADLGARVNFTSEDAQYELSMFNQTGDPMVQSVESLNHILRSGLKAALVFGDRDYACNWVGGEQVSLAASYPDAHKFREAGYEYVVTNASYNGGMVRQHGNFSFTRVFDAPHAVAAGQPETVSKIFERAMFGRDVATGKYHADECYSTKGKETTWCRNEIPEPQENICFTYRAVESCTQEQLVALKKGKAVVEDFKVVKPKGVTIADVTKVKTVNPGQAYCKTKRD